MPVQTKNIQEVSMANSRYIVNRVLFDNDAIHFPQEDEKRVADKLLLAITDTGFTFIFVIVNGKPVPHEVEVEPGGTLRVNTSTAAHDLSEYTLSEISTGEYVHEKN